MRGALLVGGVVGGALCAWWLLQGGTTEDEESMADKALTAVDEIAGVFSAPGPVADMVPSNALRDMLKKRESLRLTRYALGDGGYTWGWGHFERSANALPEKITLADAEALFDSDIEARAAKWVRLYIQVPLRQHEFDALVHIAFNLSPRSFKKFADRVNAGEGIDAMAAESVNWPAAHLRRGVQNRRYEELALFNGGVYA